MFPSVKDHDLQALSPHASDSQDWLLSSLTSEVCFDRQQSDTTEVNAERHGLSTPSSKDQHPLQADAAPNHRQNAQQRPNHVVASFDTFLSRQQIPSNMSTSAAAFSPALTEHDKVKRQVQQWFHLDSLAAVDLAIGPNSQVLAIAGDAVLKFQIVSRLFRYPDFTSSAKALHEESMKYITNKQLASVVAWQLDLHKLLRIYNFTPCNPSKAAVKKLGTAVEALLGVLAMQQPSHAEHVVGQMFCMIGESSDTRANSPAVSQMLMLCK